MNKNLSKGFTLIELLVVIAIIALLSTVISGPISQARAKARDSKKISELQAVKQSLDVYKESNGSYPASLDSLYPTYITTLPSYASPTSGLQASDMFKYAVIGTSADSYAGYHLGVHLESNSSALSADADCPAAVVGSASNCLGGATASVITSGTDFDGVDTGTSTCSLASDCMYDINQN